MYMELSICQLYFTGNLQLAVLGACRCRVSSPDPCTCAHAAANLKKEIVKMKEEVRILK